MNSRKLAVMSYMFVGLFLCAAQSRADSWQQAVTSRVSTEFETNPAMSAIHSGGVWRGLFEPSYTLTGRDEKSELSTGLAFQLARSSNKTLSPNRDSPSAFLNWLRQSEAGEFGISTRYAEVATRDSGIDATGLVSVASTRTSRTLSGNWSKALSGLSTLSVNGSYEDVAYKGGGYVDYISQTGGLRYGYDFSEGVASFIKLTGNKYTPANGGISSSLVDATTGINGKAENIDWAIQAGQSSIVGSRAVAQGSVETRYAAQRAQLLLNASRVVTPSGAGGFVKADQIRGNWSYNLSEYSNVGIDLERRKVLATLIGAIPGTSTTSGVWIDRNLTPFWRTRMYCQRRSNQIGGGNSIASNMFGLSLFYDQSDF